MTGEKCTCNCRHRHRFLNRAFLCGEENFVLVASTVKTYDELTEIYFEACENGRKWNGIVDCILENMTYAAVLKEMQSLAQCGCCERHKNKTI